MKHLPQICEAKALNGAIRTALHIKGTYKLEELKKPFVVAYLVPNLNHDEVIRAAIENMFQSSQKLFGNTPSIQQIETKVPEGSAIEASAGENYDCFVDGTYKDTEEPLEELSGEDRSRDFYCEKCGVHIEERVWDYSVEKFNMPLCYKCQKALRSRKGAGR